MIDLWQIETEITAQTPGIRICGVDEAGRGPLCGPVCAGAVILPLGVHIEGLNDSKKLNEKKREQLYDEIKHVATAWFVASASPHEIDELNILNATFLAMKRAVCGLSVKPDFALIDGNRIRGLEIPSACIIKGDAKSASVAAASIMAKVTRDRLMKKLAGQYPNYLLEKHKGYPTKEHYALLQKYGIQDFYRKTFLKNLESHFTDNG